MSTKGIAVNIAPHDEQTYDPVTSHIPLFGLVTQLSSDTKNLSPFQTLPPGMVKHALSEDKKRQEHVELTEHYMLLAIELYHTEHAVGPGGRSEHEPRGYEAICRFMEQKCWEENRVSITLAKSTLQRRVHGGKSQAQSNADKSSWLTDEETEVIINYAVNLANQGWPLSNRRLAEHANLILRGRLGYFQGVGKNWAHRFAQKHSDRLHAYWSSPLETSRARAVNPFTKEAFFKLLDQTIHGNEGEDPIPPELTYGADESGMLEGIGVKERVYGPTGQSIQHQQRSGGRELVTAIEAICADGTTIPPAIIFKGENFQVGWKQDNPLGAAIGHQSNGYTDGEIGVEWIKLFDKHTHNKAAGRWRLLLVDGHNSHYTVAFLLYARAHKIHVLCYPSHSTHVYQGLDVVIFSVMKRAWGEFRDAYEREGYGKVSKENFLEIYARAHKKAMTKDNILAAFRKTGVSPFNPDVITAEMMAPSISTSTHGVLPLPPPSPIQVIEDMIHRDLARRAGSGIEQLDMGLECQEGYLPETPTRTRARIAVSTPIRVAVSDLSSTSASFLVSQSPVQSSSQLPEYQPYTISPFKTTRYQPLLEQPPLTNLEQQLQAALIESEDRDNKRKHAMVGMQATVILDNTYVSRVQQQLQAKEKNKSKGKKKAFGDGMPKLLDGDEFFRIAEETEVEMRMEAEAKDENKRRREARKEVMQEWHALEDERKARNRQRDNVKRAAVEAWQREVDAAKAEGREPEWDKPKRADFGYERPIPRPAVVRAAAEERGSEEGMINNDNDDVLDVDDNDDDNGLFIVH